jgi:hypothetical protein
MLVDEYEQFQNDRTDDVVVSQSGSEEPETEPLADDCKALNITSTRRRRSHTLVTEDAASPIRSPQRL